MVGQDVHAVEAARSVLLELMGLLSEYRASVVIIGGWAADLLPSKGIIPHIGTVDVDEEMRAGNYVLVLLSLTLHLSHLWINFRKSSQLDKNFKDSNTAGTLSF